MQDNHRDDQDLFGTIPIAGREEKPAPAAEPQGPANPPNPPPSPFARRPRQVEAGSRSWARRLGWLAALPFAAAALYLCAGYLLAPYLLKTVLPDYLARSLGRPVTIGSASFDPFTLRIDLHNGIIGPRLADPSDAVDPLLSFGRLHLDLAGASLRRLGLICEEVNVERFFLHLVRQQDGSYNLQQLLPAGAGFPLLGRRFSLNNIVVGDSRLVFDDLPAGKTHLVEEVQLKLPALANLAYRPDQYLDPRFSAKVNGSPLMLTGETRLQADGLEARLTVHLKQFALSEYFAYLPLDLNFAVTRGSADLDLHLLVQTSGRSDPQLQIEGTGQLRDVLLVDKNQAERTLARIPAARGILSFAPLSGEYRLQDLVLEKPEVLLERTPEGQWLLPAPAGSPAAGHSARLRIDRLLVTDGKLSFTDRQVDGGYADTWSGIQLSIQGLSTIQNQAAAFAASGRNRDGARLSAQGRLSAAPLRAEGFLIADQLQLPGFNPYLEKTAPYRFRSGTIGKAEAGFTAGLTGIRLKDLAVQAEEVTLAAREEEWLRLPRVALREGAWDDQGLQLGSLTATGGFLLLDWDAEGNLNWSGPPAARKETSPSWHLRSIALEGSALLLRFRGLPAPLSLHCTATTLSFTAGSPGTGPGRLAMAGRLFDKAPIELSGSFGLEPLAAELTGSIESLPLARLQPLFTGWFRPEIRAGTLSATGSFRLPDPAFQGALRLDQVSAVVEEKEVLGWEQAASDDVLLLFRPGALKTAAANLKGPFLSWTLAGKGGSSLEQLFSLSSWTSGPLPRLSLGTIRLLEGRLSFRDLSASPPFSAIVSGITGSLAPLTSDPASRSRFTFTGSSPENGQLALAGTADLFAPRATADFRLEAAGAHVTTLSPYLADHLGWQLARGSFDYQGHIRVGEGEVQGDNRLVVNDLGLGRRLSKDTDLPLLVALLADSQGRIELVLPTSLNLEDPSAGYRERLRRALRHLLLRATVSPFSLLPAEPLLAESLHFPLGEVELSSEAKEQLRHWAEVLRQRPLLRIVVKGYADAKRDREAIRAQKEAEERIKRLEKEARLLHKLSATYGKEEIAASPVLLPEENSAPEPFAVTDELLVELAGGRSETVQRYLTAELGVAAGQVGVSPVGKPLSAESAGQGGNRVDIGLEIMRQ